MAAKKGSFEINIKELEEVVKQLENGDVTLDEMLTLYEKGVSLTKSCTKELDGAEQKINILVKDSSGDIVAQPFEGEE